MLWNHPLQFDNRKADESIHRVVSSQNEIQRFVRTLHCSETPQKLEEYDGLHTLHMQ